MAVCELAGLDRAHVVHARQHPAAIDAGAFHNDVVMVGALDRLLLHQTALVDQSAVLAELSQPRSQACASPRSPRASCRSPRRSRSYLFNSQLMSTREGIVLVAPKQAGEGRAGACLRRLVDEGMITRYELLDLDESMANGGGPACLRLRVPAHGRRN
jgi:succinylarginine dihydrolase